MKGYTKISSEEHGGPICVDVDLSMQTFGDPCNVVEAVLNAVSRAPEDRIKILGAVVAGVVKNVGSGKLKWQEVND